MHPSRLLVLAAAIAVAGGACGGDGGGGPTNADPVADFTSGCALLQCSFTNASTDADGTVESWSWNFDDGTALVTTEDAVHSFAVAGTYDVTLTVSDDDGAGGSVTRQVVVSDTPPNQAPNAAFDFLCSAEECTFTNHSTDADGAIATYSWDFDDGSALSAEASPVHSYSITALDTFRVTLTVTDDDGDSDAATKAVAVAPPATLTCGGAACTLVLNDPASVTVTLVSEDCNAVGNIFIITAPVLDTLFTDGCYSPVPGTPEATFQLDNGNLFAQGTEIEAEVISGSDDPARIAPALRVTGSYPNWTLEFDDGEDPTGPGEPDFNDLILTVTATP
jgi:PKD repeat protein